MFWNKITPKSSAASPLILLLLIFNVVKYIKFLIALKIVVAIFVSRSQEFIVNLFSSVF